MRRGARRSSTTCAFRTSSGTKSVLDSTLASIAASAGAFAALHALAEACGPSWVAEKVRELGTAQKNPKVLLDTLLWSKAAAEAWKAEAEMWQAVDALMEAYGLQEPGDLITTADIFRTGSAGRRADFYSTVRRTTGACSHNRYSCSR